MASDAQKIYKKYSGLFLIVGLVAALIVYYLTQPSPSALEPILITDIPCATTECPEGYGCISIEGGEGPICAAQEYTRNPCEFHKCPLFKQCAVAESFP